jgi:cysteine desulfurase
MAKPIYLDYNGTTPLDPEVIESMRLFLEVEFGNPSSSHAYGTKPRQAVETARRQVAALLNCAPAEVFFTSGGTESNNHAIQGVARHLKAKGNHIITSQIEHPAVIEVCRHLEDDGFETSYLPVNAEGLVDPGDVERALRPSTILISIMHANNEVGTIQPIAEISRIAHRQGIVVHTDAAQSVGKIPTDVQALGVDLLSVAGHKVYAAKGVGALYIHPSQTPEKFCYGAGQEMGRRAGTENVAAIAGLGQACEIALRDLETNMKHMKFLRDRLHEGLLGRLLDLRLNGHLQERLPNTLSLSFKGLEANRILAGIGSDVAASAGAACHADAIDISHVLNAMAVPLEWAKGTIRFSVGKMTSLADIDKTIRIVAEAVTQLKDVC